MRPRTEWDSRYSGETEGNCEQERECSRAIGDGKERIAKAEFAEWPEAPLMLNPTGAVHSILLVKCALATSPT